MIKYASVDHEQITTLREFLFQLKQPSFGLERAYLVEGWSDDVVQGYFNYSMEVAKLLGADATVAQRDLQESLGFEILLARVISFFLPFRAETNVDYFCSKNSLSLNDMYVFSETTSVHVMKNGINYELSDFILGNRIIRNVSNDTVVQLQQPYIDKLNHLLDCLPKRTVINYIIWRLINSVAHKLSEPIREAKRRFYSAYGKISRVRERWLECVDDASEYLSHATNAIYVRRYSDWETLARIESMTDQILEKYKSTIADVWTPFLLRSSSECLYTELHSVFLFR